MLSYLRQCSDRTIWASAAIFADRLLHGIQSGTGGNCPRDYSGRKNAKQSSVKVQSHTQSAPPGQRNIVTRQLRFDESVERLELFQRTGLFVAVVEQPVFQATHLSGGTE